MTTKINLINSEALDILRTACYIHGRALMKLILAFCLCVKDDGPYTLL